MKIARRTLHRRTHIFPIIRFDDEPITSYAGAVIYQVLFDILSLKDRLGKCFRHLAGTSIYGPRTIALVLILHLLLGFRRLRDLAYYEDDPLILRILGLRKLPDVATLTRTLRTVDPRCYQKLRKVSRDLVLERLQILQLARLTIDFDGSVLWTTSRNTEGTAIGFNKAKKGARSYYPFFGMVAQTAQVLDVLHRPGNIHDSNSALPFITGQFETLRREFPHAVLEARLDSAHFNEDALFWMDEHRIEFTVSVPFERFVELKEMIEKRQRWRRINDTWSFFEAPWKPKKWKKKTLRFLFYRQRSLVARKGPIQLDLFVPQSHRYEYKVVVTNKPSHPKKVLTYHNGRGAQEGILAELKSQMQMDYLPTRRLLGNQIFTISAVIAHNLNHELQMRVHPNERGTTEKRSPHWVFQKAETLRRNIIRRAARFTRPQGKLTLTLHSNPTVEAELVQILKSLGYNAPIFPRHAQPRRSRRPAQSPRRRRIASTR